jgi:hypothetical protein
MVEFPNYFFVLFYRDPKKMIPEETVIGQLMIAGYEIAAKEIRGIVKEDLLERSKSPKGARSVPLNVDVQTLQILAVAFSASESLISTSIFFKLIY